MRPVNLIPPEERRGANTPMRTGPMPYLLVGALVAALAGVSLLVLAGNQVSERKNEAVELKREDAATQRRAERLAAYTQFKTMQEQRATTIASLADSRFDWERVMRELALVLPDDVWLVQLSGSASATSGSGGDSGTGGLRSGAAGPALELEGCASGQEAVARFVTVLKDIDGVTRVGVESSELDQEAEEEASGGEDTATGANEDCQTRDFIAKFSIVVAFDAAPVPPSATEAPVATEAAEPEAEEAE
jgi:Tfp pilus assembly protein PilN